EANPVRAPSPIPVPDSTKIWVDDAEPAPPAVPPSASTSRTRSKRGMSPLTSTLPASRARPTEVAIASNNTHIRIAKNSKDEAMEPIYEKAPKDKLPSSLRSGALQPGMDGATRL